MSKRIKACKDRESLNKCETALSRVYEAGCFTTGEFRRLDMMIFNRQISIKGK